MIEMGLLKKVEEVLGRQHPLDGLRRAQGLLRGGAAPVASGHQSRERAAAAVRLTTTRTISRL